VQSGVLARVLLAAAPSGALVVAGACSSQSMARRQADSSKDVQAQRVPAALQYFPVRGRHDTGFSTNTTNHDTWSCDDANSNSDYCSDLHCTWHGSHLGNDIWADEGAPVVATVDGVVVQSEWSDYSGNRITIRDAHGFSHFSCHLQRREPSIIVGRAVRAGEIIGYVGKTGSASNGVVHLHYSIYPGDDYDHGVDPWPYLRAVERGVCDRALSRPR
jgi:hypothetical protein